MRRISGIRFLSCCLLMVCLCAQTAFANPSEAWERAFSDIEGWLDSMVYHYTAAEWAYEVGQTFANDPTWENCTRARAALWAAQNAIARKGAAKRAISAEELSQLGELGFDSAGYLDLFSSAQMVMEAHIENMAVLRFYLENACYQIYELQLYTDMLQSKRKLLRINCEIDALIPNYFFANVKDESARKSMQELLAQYSASIPGGFLWGKSESELDELSLAKLDEYESELAVFREFASREDDALMKSKMWLEQREYEKLFDGALKMSGDVYVYPNVEEQIPEQLLTDQSFVYMDEHGAWTEVSFGMDLNSIDIYEWNTYEPISSDNLKDYLLAIHSDGLRYNSDKSDAYGTYYVFLLEGAGERRLYLTIDMLTEAFMTIRSPGLCDAPGWYVALCQTGA